MSFYELSFLWFFSWEFLSSNNKVFCVEVGRTEFTQKQFAINNTLPTFFGNLSPLSEKKEKKTFRKPSDLICHCCWYLKSENIYSKHLWWIKRAQRKKWICLHVSDCLESKRGSEEREINLLAFKKNLNFNDGICKAEIISDGEVGTSFHCWSFKVYS